MARSMHEGRRVPAHPDDVRAGLAEAADRRADAERTRADALADLQSWLVAAYEISADGDLVFSEAITIAGVSRRTAYKMLEAAGVDLAD